MIARRDIEFAALHAVLLVAIWLLGAVVYSLAFADERSVVWLAIDAGLLAGAVELLRRRWSTLQIKLDWRWLAAFVVVSLGCVTAVHAIIPDANGVWLDEGNYLRTVREATIVRDGFAPFNLRWLSPFLAGAWNFIPVDDAIALKAVNFGAFVVTGAYLSLLLVRLRVHPAHALFAPVFLLCSYLGVYGATNRLVIDAFNYAAFVVLFHTLLRRDHWRFFPVVLLVAACNSEKAIYWLPIFAMVALVQAPITLRHIRDVAWLTIRYAAPALVYLIAISLYLSGSQTEGGPKFFANLHVMSFTWLAPRIANDTVALNNFQTLWFPFGAFTVYTLLGLVYCERVLKPFVLLLIPIFLQALIAHDTERMVAYAFIVYLPFGFIYLSRAFRDMPRWLAIVLFALLVVLAIGQYYALRLGLPVRVTMFKLVLSTTEIVLTSALIFLHLTFFAIAPRTE
jgi:hypothetical protein